MITIKEWIEDPRKEHVSPLWCYGQDVLEWILRGDLSKSRYKRNGGNDMENYHALIEAMSKRREVNGFAEIQENTYFPQKRWRQVRGEQGHLNVQRYVNDDNRCFDEPRKVLARKRAMSVYIDINIPAAGRNGKEMENRQAQAYEIAATCASAKRPCRIVGARNTEFQEDEGSLVSFMIVKDYTDSIYPGIWGALSTNRSTNDFCNCFSQFIVGTGRSGNGYVLDMRISDHVINNDEVIVLSDKRGFLSP